MNMRRLLSLLVIAVLTLVPSFLLTGCENEDSPNTDGIDSYFDEHPYVSDPRTATFGRVMSITPEAGEISAVGQQIAFSATGGRGVYTWDVSRPGNGNVAVTGGKTAVYTATVVGPNDVIVYDADGQAALATINGPSSPLIATANPDDLGLDGKFSVVTASGGVPPYHWSTSDIGAGDVDPKVGSSTLYTRGLDAHEDNAVTVVDSAGNSYSVVIAQP